MINKEMILEASKAGFKVWVELAVPSKDASGTPASKIIDKQEFDEKKDAQKFARDMMKKHSLKKHAGHVVNYKEYKELFTNY